MAERVPTEEELRDALSRVEVAHVLVETCTAVVSLGFHRLAPERRDLAQARIAIEALRALEPVLREGGLEEGLVRDLEQARANLQLAYANAVAEGAGQRTEPAAEPEPESAPEPEPEPEPRPEPEPAEGHAGPEQPGAPSAGVSGGGSS